MEHEINIYEEIVSEEGWFSEVMTPKKFADQINAAEKGDTVKVYFNSPGGSVFAAAAMASMIDRARQKGVTVEAHIDGIAASAASMLAMACDSIHAYETSFMMIHKPWSFAVGNSDDFLKEAENLEKIEQETLMPLYNRKSQIEEADLKAMIEAETWLSSSEMAETFGVIIDDGNKAVDSIPADKLARFRNTPKQLINNNREVPPEYYTHLRNQIDCI